MTYKFIKVQPEHLTPLSPETKEELNKSDIRVALRYRSGNRVLDCHDCPHWQDGDDNVTCEYPDCPPCAYHELHELNKLNKL